MSYEGLPVNLSLEKQDEKEHQNSISHFIRVYDDIIPENIMRSSIEHLHLRANYVDSDYLRRHEVSLSNNPHPELLENLKLFLRSVYNKYKTDLGSVSSNLYQCNHIEYPVVAQYQPENLSGGNKKEHFHDHADCWHYDSSTRVVSVILYLNDVSEGGETYFSQLGYSVQPKRGRVLVFPSNFMFMHRANPPISNPKYVCICWIHFDGNTPYLTINF